MKKKKITFYLFSDEFHLSDVNPFKKHEIKKLLDSKKNSIEHQLIIENETDLVGNKSLYAFMRSQFEQFVLFLKNYNYFIKVSNGDSRNN